MSITLLITIVTVAFSLWGFKSDSILEKFIFHPYSVSHYQQFYRFISCGFIHADLMHLAFNMFSFYMFGDYVEQYFSMIFGSLGKTLYILLYLSALVISIIPTYIKNKNSYYYRSLGASGAVSAIVFAGIFLMPTMEIGFFIIPPIIPGFIFGPIYLGLTAYLAKSGPGKINHSAHLWGSIYGIVFLIITSHFLSSYSALGSFIEQVKLYFVK